MNKWIGYQLMTTAAKKVGGPIVLLAITLGVGVFLDETVRFCFRKVRKSLDGEEKKLMRFTIVEDGREGNCVIYKGDTVKVGEIIAGKVALVKINDDEEPYFVSLDFLKKFTKYGGN